MSNESNLRICQKDVINQGGKYLVTFELNHNTLYIKPMDYLLVAYSTALDLEEQ